MQIGQFYKIAVAKQDSGKMVGGLQDNGGYALNNNQWQNYYGADGMDTAIDPNNSNMYYGFIQQGSSLYISNDAGGSSTASVSGPETGNWVTPLAANKEGEIYAGYSRLYKLCGSFEAVSPSFGTNIDFLEIDDINSDNIYVAINSSLRKSTDKGLSFTNVETFSSSITSIEVHKSNSDIVYVTTSGTSNGKVYKSIDGGLNFSNITGSLPSVTKNIIKHQDFHSQNPLFLGTSLGVYRYDDLSGDWEAFDNGLPNVSVTDLDINYVDSNLTAATYGRGVWQSDIEVEALTDELGLESIKGLSTTIACGDLSSVQGEVKNLGTNTITSIQVDYELDGVPDTVNWSGNLLSGETTLIDIPTLILTTGYHSLRVISSFNNDSYESNNSSIAKFYANELGTYNSVNNFESAEDELIVFDEGLCGNYWTRGVATGTVLNSSGNNVYGTELGGNHADNVKSYLHTECYNLSNVTSPTLKFDMAFDLEFNWDIVYVEYSTDGGENWNVLGTSSDPNWYNSNTLPGSNCLNCPGAQWTGTESTLQEYSYDLSAFEGQSSFTIRFVFHADQSVNQEGVILDNLSVDGTLDAKDFELSGFKIYPNPSNNIFNIEMKNNNEFEFEICDITGKVIIDNTKISGNSYRLDMSGFSSGMYFINLEAESQSATRKLLLN
ncbi:MAG: T9SS type A sorting domain-containing protein, partial [Flavobacteriaceae bacterium]|nr:T9SS type A sorting domain-containing protein [Flavobacteriaceae bacterium]